VLKSKKEIFSHQAKTLNLLPEIYPKQSLSHCILAELGVKIKKLTEQVLIIS
jgi:hypothetical protein